MCSNAATTTAAPELSRPEQLQHFSNCTARECDTSSFLSFGVSVSGSISFAAALAFSVSVSCSMLSSTFSVLISIFESRIQEHKREVFYSLEWP
jgi:hypothetical protein